MTLRAAAEGGRQEIADCQLYTSPTLTLQAAEVSGSHVQKDAQLFDAFGRWHCVATEVYKHGQPVLGLRVVSRDLDGVVGIHYMRAKRPSRKTYHENVRR